MTHFFTTVCLPPRGSSTLDEAVAAALAPYDYNADPCSDRPEWDWWALSAPIGHLAIKPEYAGGTQLHVDADVVVAAPKFMLDIDAMRDRSASEAGAAWDAWAELTATHPAAQPLTSFAALGPAAQTAHLAQPAVQAFAQLAAAQTHPYFTIAILIADPVAYFAPSRDAFVQAARDQAFVTWAYVTLDGEWRDQDDSTGTWEGHARESNAYLDGLPDDTILAVVDCHC